MLSERNMDILPPQPQLPIVPIQRRHSPKPTTGKRGYQEYRPCLRWDFSFSCGFCLLHELDFITAGIQGLPIFTAEHLQLQSECDSKINDYTNVINCCTWCNNARRAKPINKDGHRLLDPTEDAWGDYFRVEENRIIPLVEGGDASYTHKAYRLDDDRKLALREGRRNTIASSIRQIEEWMFHLEELKVWSEQYPADRPKFQLIARQTRVAIYETCLELKKYTPIPPDAPSKCQCETTEMHCLSAEFLSQLVSYVIP